MYQIKVDPHTHTLFSGHAFSTIGENLAEAAKKGLDGLGMADHFGPLFTPMKDGIPSFGPMMNMAAMPKEVNGVRVFASAEMDIIDFEGHLAFWDTFSPFGPPERRKITICETVLSTRDYAIASLHNFPGFQDGTEAQYTEMYLGALRNPGIQIIGHPCRPGFLFDLNEIVRTAKALGKCLEINDHSFDSPDTIKKRCRQLALKCAEEGTKVVVSSDAHSCWFIGEVGRAMAMLEEIHFPPELIANRSLEAFEETIAQAKAEA